MCVSLKDGRSVICADTAMDFLVALTIVSGESLTVTTKQCEAVAASVSDSYLIASKNDAGDSVLTLTHGDESRAIAEEIKQRRAEAIERMRHMLATPSPGGQDPMPPGKSH